MQMGSSSLLFLSILVLFLSFSSAYAHKWSLPNGVNKNPIEMIEAVVGVSEDLHNLNGMEAKNNQQSCRRGYIIVGTWGTKERTSSNIGPFDDRAYTGIREINLLYNNKTAIGGFQVTYDLNGSPFVGKNHTSNIKDLTVFTPVKISLDYPSEYIVEVSGSVGVVEIWTVVRYLTFKTNKKIYGPYGDPSGIPFSLSIENGFVIGFKGNIGGWMDYLGIYLGL